MPENPAPWIVNQLFDAGPVVSSGMGPAALGWQDLLAWQKVTGDCLKPWQARLLRRLSAEYLAEQQDNDPHRPMPWSAFETSDENRSRVDGQLRQIFNALIKAQSNTDQRN